MRNSFQATDNIGTSGQPTREEFAQIAQDGYNVVINLAMHNSDDALADEGSLVASLGMTYIHLPVPFDAPTAAQAAEFIRLMRAFDGKKIWVHCAMNLRVSAFMMHYLCIDKAYAPEQAANPLIEKWAPHMTPVWKEFMALMPRDIPL